MRMRFRRLWTKLLLRLYPRAFRERHGAELLDLASDLEVGLLPLGWDLALNAIRVRLEDAKDGRRERTRRPRSLLLDGLRRDARDSLRSLRRRPAFAAMFVATLALGIGANLATFTVLNWVVLRPLAYPDSERLVRVFWRPDSFNHRILALFQERARAFSGLSGFSGWAFTLTGEGEPEELSGAVVSPRHFEVLGVSPLVGRTFSPDEGEPGRSDVCVLAEGFWRRRFGASESVVGRRIELAGAGRTACTVIGVVADAQATLDPFGPRQAFLPLERPEDLENDSSWFLSVVGRLSPGVTLEEANAEVRGLARFAKETMYPRTSEEAVRQAGVTPLERAIVGPELRGELFLLAAAVALVLLLACGNLSALLIARYAERARELAVRFALGARRGRILKQLWAESMILGLAGGALGALFAWAAVRVSRGLLPPDIPRMEGLAGDFRVLLFAVALSLASAAAFGLPPSIRASSRARGIELRAGLTAGDRHRHRLHRLLVAFQVASCLVLLTVAGLVLEGFVRLASVDPGFDPDRALVAVVSVPDGAYPEEERKARVFRSILERISAIPGVEQTGTIHILPLDTSNWDFPVFPPGRAFAPDETPPHANFRVVSGSYFRAMGIPLLEGRELTSEDGKSSPPVGVVNESFARAIFPGRSPVGDRVRLFNADGPEFEIVGVVSDVRQRGLAADPSPEMYRPLEQWVVGRAAIVVRAQVEPASLAAPVRDAIWSVDSNLPIVDLSPLARIVAGSIATSRFVTLLLGAFALLALALAAVGIYGVASSVAGSRQREIGIRMALGSSSTSVRRRMLAQGMGPVLPGLAAGLVASVVVSRLVQGLVPKTPPWNATVVVSVAAFLGLVALAACYLPARRASRLDPVAVLRRDELL